jgi:leader peptidase (prepilin peptidase)/N-methyltransferase
MQEESLMLPFGIIELGVFVFGAIIGSFLTVCIYRLPRKQSIVTPRSACPECGRNIRWYDNVPVLSFIILGGRCRNCRASIPYRYPIVELVNGAGYVAILWRFGWGWPALVYGIFFSALLTIAWIDSDHLIIPDAITLPGIILGVLCSLWILPVGFVNSLIGVIVGGGVLLAMAWISPFLFGKEGLGGGDIKLLAMVGAFLGWQLTLATLMIASILGALMGVGLIAVSAMKRGQYMPFGPFLALGAVISLLFGPEIMAWYLGVIQ